MGCNILEIMSIYHNWSFKTFKLCLVWENEIERKYKEKN